MKSSELNNGSNPSASSPRENPCYDTDSQVAALDAIADDGVSYLLPYAQFLYTERMSNPALEKEADAPPEKMLVHFAFAKVIVLGSGLKRLEQRIQKYELKFVKSADRRLATAFDIHVATVTVTITREDV